MEVDPSKFALSASLSLLNQLQGAYHATEYYNLQMIMTEGIKTGRDLMGQRGLGQRGSSGRLRSYWGVFPPWDSRNKVTRSRSGSDQRTPMVTLFIPIVDLIREGGKVTESGVIMRERTIPFYLVKEVWLCIPYTDRCIPYTDRRHGNEIVEKILDYELEDEICTTWQRPLTPVADTMHAYRSLDRLLNLLCEMPGGPHDGMEAGIVARLSEYCGADWNEVDWDVYEDIYIDAVNFLIIHSPPPRNARTNRGRHQVEVLPMVSLQYTFVLVEMRTVLQCDDVPQETPTNRNYCRHSYKDSSRRNRSCPGGSGCYSSGRRR